MKKSYMNKNNLITEGFFEKLFRKLGISDKEKQKSIKADKKLKNAVIDLNQSNKDVEAWFKKQGIDLKLHNYSPSDFLD
tara:strand:+ start:666 stop:902 length:237 start_codon:yes stop_codon:yes gene_type:complete